MKSTTAFKETIRKYLEDRGSKDPLFARIITKPGKNIDDCITYILNEVQRSGCNGFTDDEIYSMAIHYFDEDNLSVGMSPSHMRVVVNHKIELTKEEKAKAREDAIEQYKAEHIKKIKTRNAPPMTVKKDDEKSKPKTENTLF